MGDSFNMISIDGDTSTSDTVAILANGLAGNAALAADSPGSEAFCEALAEVCTFLAKQIARDGEGATKLIEIVIEKARSVEEARTAARIISTSMLVKECDTWERPELGSVDGGAGSDGGLHRGVED